MIDEVVSAGAMPTLEMSIRFAGARQRLLQHNIANFTTPNFVPLDFSPEAFQARLRDAVDRRRERSGERGPLGIETGGGLEVDGSGRLSLEPTSPGANILFHDRNNRDLERTMQGLVENVTAYRVAVDLMRGRTALLQSAIRERP